MTRSGAAGTSRAAREGRYCGGIVSLGYVVEGQKQHARLVPSDKIIGPDWTEADLVKKIYQWLAIEGWSCPRIADHLNGLQVPTAYTKDNRKVKKRGQRQQRTQGVWRAGRIRNLVANPVYMGQLQYGRRSTKARRTGCDYLRDSRFGVRRGLESCTEYIGSKQGHCQEHPAPLPTQVGH